MNEIVIDWTDLLPMLWELRLMAFIIGTAMFTHAVCMAGFMPKESPWSIAVLVALSAGGSVGLIVGGASGNFSMMLLSALVSSAVQTTMSLWLWYHDMHVSKIVEKSIGHNA